MRKMNAIFIGDRLYVLEAMIECEISVKAIFLYKNSYAHKNMDRIKNFSDRVIIFSERQNLLEKIRECRFDLLVSNGCPFILPISRLKRNNELFINIHPSLLPQLRGRNPINGAILFNKNAGVSVHTMDDEIDRGEILAQIKIPIKDLSLGLLYRLCFKAEAEAFKMAYHNGFKPLKSHPKYKQSYYSRPKEIKTPINTNNDELIRNINAFSIASQVCKVITTQGEIRMLNARKIKNPYLDSIAWRYENYQVVESYENKILLYKDGEFLEMEILDSIAPNKILYINGGG